tara:strand:+ start:8450 stop:9097 length:648 start_codon:yes stop_codon:yes gene_type:complete
VNRFSKNSIFTVLFLLGSFYGFAQKKSKLLQTWDPKTLKQANTAIKYEGLTFQEKKVIYYINLVRMNGALFAETYLKDYLHDWRVPRTKYVRSLIKTLKELPSLPPLQPDDDLIKEAKKHAKEMGKSGKKGHRSLDGKGYTERMTKLKEKYKKIKELNQYGLPEALEIVIDLLLDEGVESLTHRRALLTPKYQYIGVGLTYHKKWGTNCSILLAY